MKTFCPSMKICRKIRKNLAVTDYLVEDFGLTSAIDHNAMCFFRTIDQIQWRNGSI